MDIRKSQPVDCELNQLKDYDQILRLIDLSDKGWEEDGLSLSVLAQVFESSSNKKRLTKSGYFGKIMKIMETYHDLRMEERPFEHLINIVESHLYTDKKIIDELLSISQCIESNVSFEFLDKVYGQTLSRISAVLFDLIKRAEAVADHGNTDQSQLGAIERLSNNEVRLGIETFTSFVVQNHGNVKTDSMLTYHSVGIIGYLSQKGHKCPEISTDRASKIIEDLSSVPQHHFVSLGLTVIRRDTLARIPKKTLPGDRGKKVTM